ncbi:ATP dependent DNA ligase [Diaporthe sp. PMI_573]|nr:ATP dependent DNA ligase [Diaporthaceae sp. PMI_573]
MFWPGLPYIPLHSNAGESLIEKGSNISSRFLSALLFKELSRWTLPGSGRDLAQCAEEILQQTPSVRNATITVEEIDALLHALAAKNSFSALSVRSSGNLSTEPSKTKHDGPLETLFRRFTAKEAKWRLILKSFLPVIVPEQLVYARCHRLLPTIMRIHDDFTVAFRFMSVENKMDGEYCQIHIDLSKGSNCIQIFSKSGKDSTRDKEKLHSVIKTSLALGAPSCKFKHCCILEGEVVVYSDREQRILSFDKLRKHISRSGRFIDTGEDSQAHEWEHLMIVYYDVLRVDDKSFLNVRHSARFSRLSKLVQCQTGRAALVQRQVVNFSSRVATEDLKEAFASCIVRREEGLVLKPDEPYFSFGRNKRRYASCCVKLKKGYIKGMGDVGDLAVVSGWYCPTKANILKMPMAKYTHFYLGCLINKEAVERWGARPEFMVINEVEISPTMMDYLRRTWFTETVPLDDDRAPIVNVSPGVAQGGKITMAFTEPAVFDMTCSSFHKESDTGFYSLRFPYISKIHPDRTFKDCLTFQELQALAEEELKCPDREDSQELRRWIEVLEEAEPKTWKAALQESQWSETTTNTSDPDITSVPSSQGDLPTPTLPRLPSGATEHDAKDTNSSVLPPPTAPTLSNPCPTRPQSSSAVSCGYAGGACALADTLLLLSPCIANMPLLAEDLLPVHGISGVFTDIPSWLASQVAQAGARMRHRRLVLVERHRSEATSAFLRELESRPLRRRDGRVEVVPAYDWRLLEAITEEERRNRRSNDGGTRQTARTGADHRKYHERSDVQSKQNPDFASRAVAAVGSVQQAQLWALSAISMGPQTKTIYGQGKGNFPLFTQTGCPDDDIYRCEFVWSAIASQSPQEPFF